MTVEEAVQLVVQAGAVGSGGDVLVLDMGEPVRIADVARRLAAISETPVPIEYTGLRPRREAARGAVRRRRSAPSERSRADQCGEPRRRSTRATCATSTPASRPCELISMYEALCDKMAAADLERYMEGDGLSVSA